MESKCLFLPNKPTKEGYVKFSWKHQSYYAHRWYYEQWHGPIPGDKEIDHICRVRACINPTHLRAVDHKTNMRNSKLSIINNGVCNRRLHSIKTESDVYVNPVSGTTCIECKRESMRRWRAKADKEWESNKEKTNG